MMKVAGWTIAGVLGVAMQAMAQGNAPYQNVLVLNADIGSNGIACLQVSPFSAADILQCPWPETYPGRFLRQGRRTELEVFNRKFLADYSITVDAVTQIQTGPNIRNLNEAANLTLNPISLVTPPSKGGSEGLVPRAADKILFDLIDETRATVPETDLRNDHEVIERERVRLVAQVRAFEEAYTLLRNNPVLHTGDVSCETVSASPDIGFLSACLQGELQTEHQGPWDGPGPYSDEPAFVRVNTRVQDLVAAVQTLGGELASANLPQMRVELEAAISQYENDWNVFLNNIQAAQDAVSLARTMIGSDFRKNLRREQMKVLLMDKLKQGAAKTLDDAEMNALLDDYDNFYKNTAALDGLPAIRWTALARLANRYLEELQNLHLVSEFEDQRSEMRMQMDVELPNAIADLNAAQSRLLNRVNHIYDQSEVREPLVKQIDISGHTGNLVVYYTIRRIENFQRYTVAPVQGPGSGTVAGGQGVALPPPAAAAPGTSSTTAGSTATPAATTASSTSGNTTTTTTSNTTVNPNSSITTVTSSTTTPAASSAASGTVVAKGSFEVHELFHANVVAAVAVSFLKNQSVTSQAEPQSCMGTPSIPDPNCFSPSVSKSVHWAPIVGLDYYFRPRDSFPRTYWLCSRDFWECSGVMGAASATKANNYFLGLFFEPALGVQFAGGANFGTKNVLQSPYTANTPVDITGSFPTSDQRGTGFFFSAGLDLGIFRKVFGKFTGIGTSASGTSGQ